MNYTSLVAQLEDVGVVVLFDDEQDEYYWLNLRDEKDRFADVGFETFNEAVEDAAYAFGLLGIEEE